MNSNRTLPMAPALVLALALVPAAARAGDEPVTFQEHSLSGPRLGVSLVSGQNELSREIESRHMGRVLSQFGWQFERQIVPEGGGPQFVVEAVPMVAGVEYGKVIPNLTLAMGVRFPAGYEFGLGPNVIVLDGESKVRSALVIALGRTFDYGGVSLPLNLVFATNPRGQRVSFILGYAVQRRRS